MARGEPKGWAPKRNRRRTLTDIPGNPAETTKLNILYANFRFDVRFHWSGVSNSGVVERTKDRGCRISLLTELVCKRKPSSFDLAIKLLTQMTLLKRQGFTFARDTKTLFICFFDGELTGSIRLWLAARLTAHPQTDQTLRPCAVSLPAPVSLLPAL